MQGQQHPAGGDVSYSCLLWYYVMWGLIMHKVRFVLTGLTCIVALRLQQHESISRSPEPWARLLVAGTAAAGRHRRGSRRQGCCRALAGALPDLRGATTTACAGGQNHPSLQRGFLVGCGQAWQASWASDLPEADYGLLQNHCANTYLKPSVFAMLLSNSYSSRSNFNNRIYPARSKS